MKKTNENRIKNESITFDKIDRQWVHTMCGLFWYLFCFSAIDSIAPHTHTTKYLIWWEVEKEKKRKAMIFEIETLQQLTASIMQ